MSDAKQLYVGDLPIKADNSFILQLFSQYGQIADNGIVLKKHKYLPKSFAFITFNSHQDAENALVELSYTKLDNVPMRISWADPESKKIFQSGRGNLFINGLDKTIETSQLYEAFSNFGEIISCYIPLTNGKSRGYGYVQFRYPEDAERAKIELGEASINGRKIEIKDCIRQTRKDPDLTFTNIYIKYLPKDITDDEDLKKIFEQFGKVQNAVIMKDNEGVSKQFGFCNMYNHEDAVEAIRSINLEGHYQAMRAMTKNERLAYLQNQTNNFRYMRAKETKGRNLYIKNFGKDVTDDDFRAYFEQFGEIESAKIAREESEPHESKMYGYCLYKTKVSAENAIKGALDIPLKGKYKLFVGFFQTREERQRNVAKAARSKFLENSAKITNTNTNLQMNGSFYAQQENVPISYKDRLKQELIAHNITGRVLKRMLISISEIQAKALINDHNAFDLFIQQENQMI